MRPDESRNLESPNSRPGHFPPARDSQPSRPRPAPPVRLLLLWSPPAALCAVAFWSRAHLPAWAFMWAMAAAIFAGCKWLTAWEARRLLLSAPLWRSLGYLAAWPGMEAEAFLDPRRQAAPPPARDWLAATVKTALGAGLIWGGVPLALALDPLAAGWVGLVGLVFLLHLGSFHLLALAWQEARVLATPIMRRPALAASIADFWSARWNRAFHLLAERYIFRPLCRPLGRNGATLAAFAASGLVHELVISLPAAGGHGLPAAYFFTQGLGLLCERSTAGRRLGLGRGWRGRLFTVLTVLGPLLGLFHPLFVHRVILPFLAAIKAC